MFSVISERIISFKEVGVNYKPILLLVLLGD